MKTDLGFIFIEALPFRLFSSGYYRCAPVLSSFFGGVSAGGLPRFGVADCLFGRLRGVTIHEHMRDIGGQFRLLRVSWPNLRGDVDIAVYG